MLKAGRGNRQIQEGVMNMEGITDRHWWGRRGYWVDKVHHGVGTRVLKKKKKNLQRTMAFKAPCLDHILSHTVYYKEVRNEILNNATQVWS